MDAIPEDWPPTMPLSGSINVAERIFFKILKKDALKKVKTKTQRKLFELLSEDESRVINIDDLTGDGQPFVSVYILKDVEEKIGKFLSVSEDLPIIVHPKLVARALRKVPEEDDRRAIASCIINKYIRMEERQNRKLSEEVGHSNLMTRESHHEGSTGYDDEKSQLENYQTRFMNRLRVAYINIIQGTFKQPPFSWHDL